MKELKIEWTDKLAIVDDQHYDRLVVYRWMFTGTIIRRKEWHNKKNRQINIALANEIMQDYEVMYDHKDLNPFNNLEDNLRIASKSQNTANVPKRKGNYTSKYKGRPCWDKARNKWQASICINDNRKFLGRFNTEAEAAVAYNNAALKYFEEFAFLNIIE